MMPVSYKIQDKLDSGWRDYRSFANNSSYEVILSYYDRYRIEFPDVEFRLIEVREHIVRHAKGSEEFDV